ncbi:MAG: molybdopterin-synthase adenylyltransferase MoeB [Halioglobus sp.]
MLNDQELQRYSRQILLNDFDIAGQERLKAASVLVVGLGGLGSPVALYLGASGVGRLLLADGDAVEPSNLQRQVAHTENSLGSNKAESAAAAVKAINPLIKVEAIPQHLDEQALATLLEGVDVVVDATDNYPTRYALNRACLNSCTPLVSGAAVRLEAQLTVFDPARGGPCYRCMYPQQGAEGALNCSESGVLAPVVGALGSLQALEVVKLIAGVGQTLRGRLMMLDLTTHEVRYLTLNAREDCPDCAHLHSPE